MEIAALQKNEAELVEALENRYGKGKVHCHDKPVLLEGYDSQAEKHAHLVIKKTIISSVERTSGYNDVGFERNKSGGYTMHYDQADLPKTSLDKVMQDYAERVASKTMKAKGYTMRREALKDGTVKLSFSKYS
jgi:hypothetical protein